MGLQGISVGTVEDFGELHSTKQPNGSTGTFSKPMLNVSYLSNGIISFQGVNDSVKRVQTSKRVYKKNFELSPLLVVFLVRNIWMS